MKILSLDIATKTGWALSNTEYGLWNMKRLKDESMGMRLIRFKAKLKELYKLEGFDVVVYERPAGRHANAIIHQSKLIAMLEEWCELNEVECKAYSASHIKKYATGKGNAGKPAMIEAAKVKYNYSGDDDNEADAIHLLNLAKDELQVA